MPYGIQQPAVSGQVLALEEFLHTRLFAIRRPFALTPAGRRLAEFITPFFENLAKSPPNCAARRASGCAWRPVPRRLRDHVPGLLKQLHRQVRSCA